MPRPRASARLRFTLLESAHTVPLPQRAAYVGSVFAQMAAVAVLAIGTSHVVRNVTTPDTERATFLAPLFQPRPRPMQEKLSYAALGGVASEQAKPAVGTMREAALAPSVAEPELVGSGDSKPPSTAHEDEVSHAFSEIEVDSVATSDPESEGPVYPPALMAKGVEGFALVSFVVDRNGRPDVRTFFAIESTDSLFVKAVRDALPRMKFHPAKRMNQAVPQEVEQRFSFRVTRPVG
jgi:TonB family protein